MKKCPACAEEIQDEAKKCKHCGEFLAAPAASPLVQHQSGSYGCLGCFVLLVVLGSLFLVWATDPKNRTHAPPPPPEAKKSAGHNLATIHLKQAVPPDHMMVREFEGLLAVIVERSAGETDTSASDKVFTAWQKIQEKNADISLLVVAKATVEALPPGKKSDLSRILAAMIVLAESK